MARCRDKIVVPGCALLTPVVTVQRVEDDSVGRQVVDNRDGYRGYYCWGSTVAGFVGGADHLESGAGDADTFELAAVAYYCALDIAGLVVVSMVVA